MGFGSGPVTIRFTNQTIQFTDNSVLYTLNVPDAKVTFDAGAPVVARSSRGVRPVGRAPWSVGPNLEYLGRNLLWTEADIFGGPESPILIGDA